MPLRRNRSVAWIAAFAVLLQALWPLLAQARPKDPSLQVPVCTIDGVTHYLEIKTGKTPLEERSSTHGEHCKLCVFGADRVIAVPPGLSFDVAAAFEDPGLVEKTQTFQSLSLLPAHPRAPPALS